MVVSTGFFCLYLYAFNCSSSFPKNFLEPTMKLSSNCRMTMPARKSLFCLYRHGSALDRDIPRLLLSWSIYLMYQWSPDSGIPYKNLTTLRTLFNGKFISVGGLMYTSRSNEVWDCVYAYMVSLAWRLIWSGDAASKKTSFCVNRCIVDAFSEMVVEFVLA